MLRPKPLCYAFSQFATPNQTLTLTTKHCIFIFIKRGELPSEHVISKIGRIQGQRPGPAVANLMSEDKQNIAKMMFGKRQQKARWVFGIASLPFFLFALWGAPYGAFPVYFIPGMICLLQVFYPTLFVWSIIFFLYALGAGIYVFAVIRDILRMIGGRGSGIFLDFTDTVVFLVLISLIIALAITLIKLRPTRLKNETD